jgi:hypothetical protein
MYNFTSYVDDYGTSYSKAAEKKIIDCLLREHTFRNTETHRLLATYPNAPNPDKNKIIIQLMRLIWGNEQHFNTFSAFDHLLSIPKRGHFIHQFEVFLLGMNIILCAINKGCDSKKYFGFESINEITYCWLFTSAAHDFGYPIESFEKIIEKLSELYADFEFNELSKRLNEIKIINAVAIEPEFSKILLPSGEAIQDIGSIVFREIQRSLNIIESDQNLEKLQERLVKENNHGYVSAILLFKSVMRLLKENKSNNDEWMYEALNRAISAVALHSLKIDKDTDDSYFIKKISFQHNPYAFLLFLVDNVQDWNRSSFPDASEKWAEYFLDHFSSDASKIELRYSITHERWEDIDLETVRNFLGYKKKMLEMIIPHPEEMKIQIQIHFQTNLGYEFDSIVVNI